MAFSVSGFFNRGKAKQSTNVNQSTSPYFTDTGFSTTNGRSVRLDPSIRGIQDSALQNYAGLYGDFGNATDRFLTQSKGLRDSYLGNQGVLMESRLRPIREQYNQLYSNTQQDLGRRGVGGSSFGYNTLRDIRSEQALREGDVRAETTAQMAELENTLNNQELQALTSAAQQRAQVTGETLEVAKARLAQEMGLLGLGSQTTGNTVTAGNSTQWGLSGSYGIK